MFGRFEKNSAHIRVVHGSDGPTGRVGSGRVGSGRVGSGRVGSGRVGRVGSGRVGSGRVTILPDFGGSGRVSTSDFLVFYLLFLGT